MAPSRALHTRRPTPRHPLLGPFLQGGEYRRKLARHLHGDVLDEDRPLFSIDFSFDQSQIFQFGQSLRKHTVADAVDTNANLGEAGRIFDERGDNEAGSAAAEQFRCRLVVRTYARHGVVF